MQDTIAIALATFNGAQFLPRQLESLAAQSHTDWHLFVRDDGSEDETVLCLERFAARYPDRVSLIRDGLGRLGARGNFSAVMGYIPMRYIAFCDQDDVWRQDKLARTFLEMRRLVSTSPKGMPLMVHADRRLIDAEGCEITPSYWRSRALSPRGFRHRESYYAFCLAAGSTMMINRALLDMALPVPEAARMHDCWIELVAHAFGRVRALDEIVLAHRRHGANASGATKNVDSVQARNVFARAVRLLSNLDRQRAVYRLYFEQATAFRARFSGHLSPCAARRLDHFLSLPERSLPGRLYALLAARAAPPGIVRAATLAFLSNRKTRPNQTAAITRAASA